GDGLIILQGMADHNAESVKSLENCHVAWCEESQSLSARSLALLWPTIRAENSELWFSFNPRRKTDPVDEFFRGLEAARQRHRGEAHVARQSVVPGEEGRAVGVGERADGVPQHRVCLGQVVRLGWGRPLAVPAIGI